MGHQDSRRWTGRSPPGELPPECAGSRPHHSRSLRWWLFLAVLGSIALAVAQPRMPDGHDNLPSLFAEWAIPFPDPEDAA